MVLEGVAQVYDVVDGHADGHGEADEGHCVEGYAPHEHDAEERAVDGGDADGDDGHVDGVQEEEQRAHHRHRREGQGLGHEHRRDSVAVREEEVVGPRHHVELPSRLLDRPPVGEHRVHAAADRLGGGDLAWSGFGLGLGLGLGCGLELGLATRID